ncbi:unnamed protein product [Cyclocybe aegerita]|uniref:Het-C-domain-containing protein n=1 Tax=Cyclocybe aegerita TaxID=1973307 RepID=A0A8S0W6I7_CYCAE|nr:unnamed protein product [Cyclocybe aegerita]
MGFSPSITNTTLLLTVLVILLPVKTYAFGAGDIPDFAYLNDKAFRHGDIENVLETLVKSAGGGTIGGAGLLGIASSVLKHVAGGSKFSKSDIKKVYFGNWLRDYSQAMDIAGLSKLSANTLILVVSVLGFMTFGYSTEEFEVTADRLGVYLPVEHIDNPKGYAEKEGDARNFHPKLRPPVQSEELEIDARTGMKKYMATENQGWDTSTAFIRRTFRACIERGRRAQGNENADLWEAFRLLGTGLHTMEDLLAHSNWCEIALRKLGHRQVFCHVGDRVTVNTPNGPAPPLVTGTFGSADFLHSLLGEAGDKLSQASVTDLSSKLNNASQQGGSKPDISKLQDLLSKFGGGGDDNKLNKGEEIKQQAQGYDFNPDNVAPPEVQQKLLDILKWHDDVMRDIVKKIEMVPGLTDLLDEFSNALNEYIYTVLAPYLGPILTQATSALDEGSKAVIDNDDQYEVFNNPNAHDPSHSLLSKDHFGLILNEPAGKIAQIVVVHTVNLLVRAWGDSSNPDDVLEAFHHPYFATGRSEIQNKMFDQMQKWIGGFGGEVDEILQALTKESVREHKNKRKGLEDTPEPGYGGCGHGYNPSQTGGSVAGVYSASKPTQSYGRNDNSGGYQSQSTYGSSGRSGTSSYGSDHPSGGYGSQRRDDNTGSYVGQTGGYGGQRRNDDKPAYGGYGGQRRDEDSGYGQRHDDKPAYGGSGGYSGQQRDDDSSYGQRRDDKPAYGGGGYGSQRRDDDDSRGYSASGAHGGRSDNQGYGRDQRDDSHGPARTYGGQNQTGLSGGYTPSYGQSGGGQKYGKKDESDDDDRRGGRGKKYGQGNDSDDEKEKKKSAQSSYGGGYRRGGDDNNNHGRLKKDKDDSDDDDRKRHGKHSKKDSDDDRKPGGYGGQSGYTPSYGQGSSGHGGRDDTFGAERLNIGGREDDSDDDKKRRNKYGGGRY